MLNCLQLPKLSNFLSLLDVLNPTKIVQLQKFLLQSPRLGYILFFPLHLFNVTALPLETNETEKKILFITWSLTNKQA